MKNTLICILMMMPYIAHADLALLSDIKRRAQAEEQRQTLSIEQRLEKAKSCHDYETIQFDVQRKTHVIVSNKKIEASIVYEALSDKIYSLGCIDRRKRR